MRDTTEIKARIDGRIINLEWLARSNSKVIPYNAQEGERLQAECDMAEEEIEFLKEILELLK